MFDEMVGCEEDTHSYYFSGKSNVKTKIQTSDSMSFIDVSESFKLSFIAFCFPVGLFLHNDSNVIGWSLYIKRSYDNEGAGNSCEDTT